MTEPRHPDLESREPGERPEPDAPGTPGEPHGLAEDIRHEIEEVARVPLNDRFRTGGVNSIRGYGESTIPVEGGLTLLQANAELRIPLLGPFGVEVFVDAGNVWARPSYVKGRDFSPRWNDTPLSPNEVRYVFGIGPRINLPIGPLRLDVAWSLRPSPGETHPHQPKAQFAIGPSF